MRDMRVSFLEEVPVARMSVIASNLSENEFVHLFNESGACLKKSPGIASNLSQKAQELRAICRNRPRKHTQRWLTCLRCVCSYPVKNRPKIELNMGLIYGIAANA